MTASRTGNARSIPVDRLLTVAQAGDWRWPGVAAALR